MAAARAARFMGFREWIDKRARLHGRPHVVTGLLRFVTFRCAGLKPGTRRTQEKKENTGKAFRVGNARLGPRRRTQARVVRNGDCLVDAAVDSVLEDAHVEIDQQTDSDLTESQIPRAENSS